MNKLPLQKAYRSQSQFEKNSEEQMATSGTFGGSDSTCIGIDTIHKHQLQPKINDSNHLIFSFCNRKPSVQDVTPFTLYDKHIDVKSPKLKQIDQLFQRVGRVTKSLSILEGNRPLLRINSNEQDSKRSNSKRQVNQSLQNYSFDSVTKKNPIKVKGIGQILVNNIKVQPQIQSRVSPQYHYSRWPMVQPVIKLELKKINSNHSQVPFQNIINCFPKPTQQFRKGDVSLILKNIQNQLIVQKQNANLQTKFFKRI